jgi:hypothetical protein
MGKRSACEDIGDSLRGSLSLMVNYIWGLSGKLDRASRSRAMRGWRPRRLGYADRSNCARLRLEASRLKAGVM